MIPFFHEGKSTGQSPFVVFLLIPWRSNQHKQMFVHLESSSPFSSLCLSLPFDRALFVLLPTILIATRKKIEKRTKNFLFPES